MWFLLGDIALLFYYYFLAKTIYVYIFNNFVNAMIRINFKLLHCNYISVM